MPKCPYCGGNVSYIPQYQRYYCYHCQRYVEPVEEKPASVRCPYCGEAVLPSELEWHIKYACPKGSSARGRKIIKTEDEGLVWPIPYELVNRWKLRPETPVKWEIIGEKEVKLRFYT